MSCGVMWSPAGYHELWVDCNRVSGSPQSIGLSGTVHNKTLACWHMLYQQFSLVSSKKSTFPIVFPTIMSTFPWFYLVRFKHTHLFVVHGRSPGITTAVDSLNWPMATGTHSGQWTTRLWGIVHYRMCAYRWLVLAMQVVCNGYEVLASTR